MPIFKLNTVMRYIFLLLSVSSFPMFGQQNLNNKLIGILNVSNNTVHQPEIKNSENNQKNVDELGFILYDLIQRQDIININSLIDSYISLEGHDKELVKYIYSEIAILNKEYELAVKLYTEMLSQQPNMLLVELKLAQALIHMKSYDAALSVYQKIQSKYSERVSVTLAGFIAKQIAYLTSKNQWQGTIKLGSSYDFNLNEASNSREAHCYLNTCIKSGNRSIAGGKWNYDIKLSRRLPLVANHSSFLVVGLAGIEPMKEITTRKVNTIFGRVFNIEIITIGNAPVL